MDFRKLASGAETLFSRAKQYTGEKLGQTEKTEYEPEFQDLLDRNDKIKLWSEKIITQCEILIQPNQAVRIEDFVSEKLQNSKGTHLSELDQLSSVLSEASENLGIDTIYGKRLKKLSDEEKKMAEEWKIFCKKISNDFIIPMKEFLDGKIVEIGKEKKLLENKRLDLDVAKTKYKKAESKQDPNDLKKAAEYLKNVEDDYNSQLETTKKLLQDLNGYEANHTKLLINFEKAQSEYFSNCSAILKNINSNEFGLECQTISNKMAEVVLSNDTTSDLYPMPSDSDNKDKEEANE